MKHELLSPAGSLETCRAVLAAGADACYLAGESFGARAYAKNLTEAELLEAIDTAHLYDKKIYLAVNTLLKNEEIEGHFYEMLLPLYEAGLDAVIVQDMGVISFIRENFPSLSLHASTQMSVCSSYGAGWLKKQGISRVVAARELDLKEIQSLCRTPGIDIECFVHGAMCYSYSGHCLMSSMIGGRSGNRGRCAQPCRLDYDIISDDKKKYSGRDKYPLSMKDLCSIDMLPELMDAGIFSFKIEGRMKQTRYAAGVTALYRKYIDLAEDDPENFSVSTEDIELLHELGSRGEFTKGYYMQRCGRGMLSSENSAHTTSDLIKDPKYFPEPIPVDLCASFFEGESSYILARAKDKCVVVTGEAPQRAKSRPVSEEDIKKQLAKCGGSVFKAKGIQVRLDEDIFIPVGKINELRRRALEKLKESLILDKRRTAHKGRPKALPIKANDPRPSAADEPGLIVRVSSDDALGEVLKRDYVDAIEADFMDGLKKTLKMIHSAGKKAGICLPRILRRESAKRLKELKDVISSFDYIAAGNYDELGLLEDLGFPKEKIRLFHSLYVYSDYARRSFEDCGYDLFETSMELNGAALSDMDLRLAVLPIYGYQPLMVSAQCVYKNYSGCVKYCRGLKKASLKDRTGRTFYAEPRCDDCYNIIYNSVPLCLFKRAEDVKALSAGGYLISFTDEDPGEISQILELYEASFLRDDDVSERMDHMEYTNGHFTRGAL